MTSICIPYLTSEGQTAKIAEYIADLVIHHDLEAQPVDLKEAPDVDLTAYDGVIVGASIHRGKHDKRLGEFVERNRDVLARIPSAFFSVSLAATVTPARRRSTSRTSSRRPSGGPRRSPSSAARCSTRSTGSSPGTS
nr:flavodoxin domain-containing protein [Nocardioides ungokensis]